MPESTTTTFTTTTSGTSNGPMGSVPEINIGFSDAIILTVSIIGFIMLGMTTYSIIIMRLKSAEEIAAAEQGKEQSYDELLANADVSTLNRAQRRARARHIMKQQRRIAPLPSLDNNNNNNNNNNDNDNDNDDNDNDDNPNDNNENAQQLQLQQHPNLPPALLLAADHPSQPQPHLSRKERQKAAKAAEKEERRLFEEKRKQQQFEALQQAQKEKKEREFLLQVKAEEERRLRQEQQKQEELAAYHAWKTFLESPNNNNNKSISVKEWIQELENNISSSSSNNNGSNGRVVYIKDLAKRFEVSEDVVVARIQNLLQSCRITGVLEGEEEEEGSSVTKFIYVPLDEMSTLASYIQTQDQVSLKQIAEMYDEIINKKIQ